MMKSVLAGGLLLICGATSVWAQAGVGSGNDQFQELLKKADRNGDGQLDNAERAAVSKHLDDFLKKEFATKADKNGDGQLSVSERMTLKEMIEKKRMDVLRNIPGGNNNRSNQNANQNSNAGGNSNNANNNGFNPNAGNPQQQPKGPPENYRGVFPGGLDGAQFPPGVRPGFTNKPDGFKPNAAPGKPAGR